MSSMQKFGGKEGRMQPYYMLVLLLYIILVSRFNLLIKFFKGFANTNGVGCVEASIPASILVEPTLLVVQVTFKTRLSGRNLRYTV